MSGFDKELEKTFQSVLNSVFKGLFYGVKTLFIGFRELPRKKGNWAFLAGWTVAGWALVRFRLKIWELIPQNDYTKYIKYLVFIGFALPFIYIYYKGMQYKEQKRAMAEQFEEIGFYSGVKKKRDPLTGEEIQYKNTPELLKMEQQGKKVLYTFKSNIPLDDWKSRGKELETVLNLHIVKIDPARKSKQILTLHTIPAENGLGEFIPWSNQFIRQEAEKFELVVGASMLDEVVFNLDKLPHMLIAGLTGSGKSVLETCLTWQCIRKGAKTYMIDFKGGVEFGEEFEKFGEVVFERTRAIELLKKLVEENTLRLALFRRERVKNLGEYNQKNPKKPLSRVVVVCDEVAEMLDKEGADKQTKAECEEISKLLSTIARLSRAPGINLILATQRPDAKIITGQIKANLPIRISGAMVDSYNSEMVLGNTKATEINADIKGRFMYSMGVETHEFQAYAFNTKYIEPGNYQAGRMLIDGEIDITPEEIQEVQEETRHLEPQQEKKLNKIKSIFTTKKPEPEPEPEPEEPEEKAAFPIKKAVAKPQPIILTVEPEPEPEPQKQEPPQEPQETVEIDGFKFKTF